MYDSDLAELYGMEIKRLNEQVKRNRERFPIHKCGEAVLWDFVSEVKEPETPKCDTSMRTSLS
jgi:hypothetical protein